MGLMKTDGVLSAEDAARYASNKHRLVVSSLFTVYIQLGHEDVRLSGISPLAYQVVIEPTQSQYLFMIVAE